MTQLLLENAPLPTEDAWVHPPDPKRPSQRAWRPTDSIVNWMTRLQSNVRLSPAQINSASIAAHSASVSATDLTDGNVAAGLYRVSYFAAIVQAATTSSSLTVTVSFTHRGTAKSASGAAITGNTISTFQSGELPLIYSDGAAPITYATTYASVGATPMLYDLIVTLERVSA